MASLVPRPVCAWTLLVGGVSGVVPRVSFAAAPGAACHGDGGQRRGQDHADPGAGGADHALCARSLRREGALGLLDEARASIQICRWSAAGVLVRAEWVAPRADPIHGRLRPDALAEVPVRYLSTGQKKRAALARDVGAARRNLASGTSTYPISTPLAGLVMDLVRGHCGGRWDRDLSLRTKRIERAGDDEFRRGRLRADRERRMIAAPCSPAAHLGAFLVPLPGSGQLCRWCSSSPDRHAVHPSTCRPGCEPYGAHRGVGWCGFAGLAGGDPAAGKAGVSRRYRMGFFDQL